jgi:hypothetical protein
VWLIEANTNPCLETSSPILGKIIPSLLENTFKVTLDSQFPMPALAEFPLNKKPQLPENVFESNKFELVFDEVEEFQEISKLAYGSSIEIYNIREEVDEYDDEDKPERQ